MEVVQRLTTPAECLLGLSAFRQCDGIIGLSGQCLAEIVDRFLVVAQGEVQVPAIAAVSAWARLEPRHAKMPSVAGTKTERILPLLGKA
jgi:hypothetical protein